MGDGDLVSRLMVGDLGANTYFIINRLTQIYTMSTLRYVKKQRPPK